MIEAYYNSTVTHVPKRPRDSHGEPTTPIPASQTMRARTEFRYGILRGATGEDQQYRVRLWVSKRTVFTTALAYGDSFTIDGTTRVVLEFQPVYDFGEQVLEILLG